MRETERADWLARVMSAAAEDAGLGVMMTAVQGGTLKNLYTHDAAERLFGYPEGRLLDFDPLALLMGEDPGLGDQVAAFIASGAYPPSYSTTVTRSDGQSRMLEVGLGGLTVKDAPAVVSILADVTEWRLHVESLRRSEERFRKVVESIPEAIFMTRGTRLVYRNRAFAELFGVTGDAPERVRDILEFVAVGDAPRFKAHLEELGPGQGRQAEYSMVSLDEREVTLEVSAMGVDTGERGALFLGHDATSRRQLETQLLQADRIEVLGTLAAGMAHAINNPLSYTLLNLEHVARRMRELGTDQEYYAEARVRLAEAHDGAERVAKVVRQMRALSRARSTSAPGPADVRAVLENVLSMIGNEIRYSAQLVLRYEPAPQVWAREGDLEQALLGLILYVARALPDRVPHTREIRVSLGTSAVGEVVLTVLDEGLVLLPGENTDLLDPFGSASSGLGLTMSHSVFSSLGGHLDIERKAEGGTVFRVTLPPADARLAEGAVRAPPTLRTVQPQAPPSRARVLVVDDDPGVASTLRAMLEAQHEVKSVESAREGLRILMGSEEFDVVFCDLVMPEVSGIDLYCAMELNRPERAERFVFMTGGVFTPEAERFLSRVHNPRVEKPFSLSRVEQLLAQAVAPRPPPASAIG
jgi:PAS domain S-box-containing protein